MILRLQRQTPTPDGMLGSLAVNGSPFCYTLERGTVGAAAIPAGTYTVAMYASPKFGRMMPLLQNVPKRTLIEIHPGNTEMDSEGCIEVGYSENAAIEEITSSREASDDLNRVIAKAARCSDPVSIEILDAALSISA
jgi:hypothetical protein